MKKLKANKWLGAILLIVTITAFGAEITVFGEESSQTIRIVRPLETEEAENFTEPPKVYEDENGAVYDLADWKLDRLPGSRVSQETSRQVVYRAVEGAQTLPSTIQVREGRTDGAEEGGSRDSGNPVKVSQVSGYPESGGTQERGGTHKSSGTQKSSGIQERNGAPESGGAQESSGTLESGRLPEPPAPQEPTGTLHITETQILGETWSDDFQVPMVFHSYGAQTYELGTITMSAQDGFPPPEEYQDELLGILGLPRDSYEITRLSWNGEPYISPDGELCREAMASGRKRLTDYQVTYEGRISWQQPDSFSLEAVYRLHPPAVETADAAPPEPAAAEMPPEPARPPLWYWVRSGFVVTVAAGLAGIAVGIIILLAVWLKRERDSKRQLSNIKG